MNLRIFVVVATVSRAELTCLTVARLADQTRPADGIIVVGAGAGDIEGVDKVVGAPVCLLAERGLCNQRNHALEFIGDRADIVIFFDDDFVPAKDFLEQTEKLFTARPELVGATGRVIADGVRGLGIEFEDATAIVDGDPGLEIYEWPEEALYGCNMIVRLSAVGDLRFDPVLPMYGWQEDVDFTFQLGQRGPMIKFSRLRGVHMGAKGGRTSGKRLGYSQISNPVYLLRKGTMPPKHVAKVMWRMIASNLFHSIRPEAHIDRRGRAWGNLVALKDWATGSLDPRRILEMT